MFINRKALSLAVVVFFISLLGTTLYNAQRASAVTATDWKAGKIIDDHIFTAKDDMSVAQIQAFLNNMVGTGGYDSVPGQCDFNGSRNAQPYSSSSRADYAVSLGRTPHFTCLNSYYEVPKTEPGPGIPANNYGGVPIPSGAKSAAQLIWDAAQSYNINPKVLLVTIQKESAGPLTTDDWPFQKQYTYAMGAHCPDSGPGGSANCDPNYAGFSIQISESAALFRYYLDNMNQSWWSYKKLGSNTIQYNPNTSCGSSNVNIETMATAALYTYTPYQPNAAALNNLYGTGDNCSAYGNRNFWRIYNDWFGSTQFPQPNGAILFYQTSTSKIYLVTTANNTKYYIPSWNMLQNYQLDKYGFVFATDATLQTYTDGGALTNLLWDNGNVYLVNNRAMHPVSPSMCTAWALSCFDNTQVKTLGSTFQTQYLSIGINLTNMMYEKGVIYHINNGAKEPIANPKTLSDLGYANTPLLIASTLNATRSYGPLLMTTIGIVQFAPSTTIYYYNGVSYYSVPGMSVYNDYNLGALPRTGGPKSSYNDPSTPPTSTPLSVWYQDQTNQNYIVDQGRKVAIPSTLISLWQNVTFTTDLPAQLLNTLPTITLKQNIWTNPSFFVLSNGAKHYVPTYYDYFASGIQLANTTSLALNKLLPVPAGADYLGEGRLITLGNDNNTLYVINNRETTRIPNQDVLNAYRLGGQTINNYPTTILNDYPTAAKPLPSAAIGPDNTYYIVFGSNMYKMSQAEGKEYGVKSSSFDLVSQLTISKASPQTMSAFLRDNTSGKIYYASGGAIHYVSSYASFVAYGGNRLSVTPVNSKIINLFLEAQSI